MMSYYYPEPRQNQKRLPRRLPKKVVPSGIGDEGIIGDWLMYYAKGGDHLHDFSPYDNHGTIYGAKWVQGEIGWALDFDGDDDYVEVPDSTELRAGILTVSVWFKPAVKVSGWIINKYNYGIQYNRNGNGEIDYMGRFESVGFTIKTWVPPSSIVGEWHHATLVWDGTYLIGYFDGEQVGKWDFSGDSLQTSTDPLRFGTWDGTGEWFNGSVDEPRIYDRALSAQEISLLYSRSNV